MKTIKNLFFGIALLSALLLASCADKGYTIKGTVETSVAALDSVLIYDFDRNVIASAPVIDNKFVIKGTTAVARKVLIGNSKYHITADLILENEPYTVTFVGDEVLIKGGTIHTKVLAFKSSDEYRKAAHESYDADIIEVDDENPEQAAAVEKIIQEKADKLVAIENGVFTEILNGKYPAIMKMFALTEMQPSAEYPNEKRVQLLDEYEKEIGKHETADLYRSIYNEEIEALEGMEEVSVGMTFKNIEAQNVQKQAVTLADVVSKNKFTILEFWASWCGPCRAEIPKLKKAYEAYHVKGLEIYSISVDDVEADWLKALDEEQTPWVNVRNAEGFGGQQVKMYGVRGIPATFLINREGKIVAMMDELRGKNLVETLAKLIK